MAPQIPQPGMSESESHRTTGGSSTMSPAETQLQHSHHLVHCDAAIAATENMTPDPQLRNVRKTRSSKNAMQHVIRCAHRRIVVDG